MSVRRVCVHTERDEGTVAIDVALPADALVGELLPAIVDMVDDHYGSPTSVDGWRLDRLAGGVLVESLSLVNNGVRDGELLVLTTIGAPTLGPMPVEPCLEVAAADLPARDAVRSLPGAACIVAAVVAAVALAWTGVVADPTQALLVTGAGTCAAVAAALTRGQSTALCVAAVTLAAATGFLAVPSGRPSAANVFLAAAAAFSTSLLTMRLTRCHSSTLVALASLSALIAVATLTSLPVQATGAALSTAALGMLALSPRLAVLAARLGPDQWAEGVTNHATAGHDTLTGLVMGCAGGVATGAVLLAIADTGSGATRYGSVAFAGLVALVAVLRARTYVDGPRQLALVSGGVASGIACFAMVVVDHPDHAGWYGGALVAIGLAVASRPPFGQAVARVLDRLEYAALAALVPLACWVGGVYELARGFHLS